MSMVLPGMFSPPPPSPVAQPVSPPPVQYSAADNVPSYTPRYANTGGGGVSYSPSGGVAPAGAPGAFPVAATVNPNDTPYWWMMSIPDVAPIINQAVSGGHDADWIKANIERTGWWQQNSDSTRNWLQLQAQDPATANQDLVQKATDIMMRAQALGLGFNWDFALGLAHRAITENWDEAAVNHNLGMQMWGPNGTNGILQGTKEKLSVMAKQYGVPTSDQALTWLTDSVVFDTGGDTSAVQGYFANAAKSLYPAAAKAIDNGQTLDQFFDPYRQIAAKALELSPDAIDLNDPKWNKAINSYDPKTGTKFALSLGDFQTMIKTNPVYGYDHTLGAKQEAANLAQSMLQSFGRQ